MVHLLRAHPVSDTRELCETLQDMLQDTVRQCIDQPAISADQWDLARLPIQAGGLYLPHLPSLAVIARTGQVRRLLGSDPGSAFSVQPAPSVQLGGRPWLCGPAARYHAFWCIGPCCKALRGARIRRALRCKVSRPGECVRIWSQPLGPGSPCGVVGPIWKLGSGGWSPICLAGYGATLRVRGRSPAWPGCLLEGCRARRVEDEKGGLVAWARMAAESRDWVSFRLRWRRLIPWGGLSRLPATAVGSVWQKPLRQR